MNVGTKFYDNPFKVDVSVIAINKGQLWSKVRDGPRINLGGESVKAELASPSLSKRG